MVEAMKVGIEREETPMTDIEAAFERLIECLEEFNDTLTDDQYKRLLEHLPTNLTSEELGDAVGKLIGANSQSGDFANVLTDTFIETMQQCSPENLTKQQLISISQLLPAGAADGVLNDADYRFSVELIAQYYEAVAVLNNDKKVISGLLTEMIGGLLVKLDTGFSMESLEKLCEHYDGHETVVAEMVNGRTAGTIVDESNEVRIPVRFGKPKSMNDLNDEIMVFVDKIINHGGHVDRRIWDQLLVHAPQYKALKKKLKKIEKAVGMHDLRKQIKHLVD